MCFLKSKEGFEKYLQYLVGQSQAESALSDKSVHRFFKVTPEMLSLREIRNWHLSFTFNLHIVYLFACFSILVNYKMLYIRIIAAF